MKRLVMIPEEISAYLQATGYEVEGLKVLWLHAKNAGASEEIIENIYDRFQRKYTEFQIAKEEMWNSHRGNCSPTASWYLDYSDGYLYVADDAIGGENNA